ncbi:hypothetical protein MMC19_001496 [Ptychographa xylographoides]|nr:hypothetical protein [Ptychographa xylographoides]
MDDFYQTTENQSDSLLLPIDKITGKFSFMQAKAFTDADQLKKQIPTLIQDINLIQNAQNVVASAVIKSSVKTDNMDDNTLRVIINDSFPSLPENGRAEIYEQMAIIILPQPPSNAKTQAAQALEQIYKNNPILTGDKAIVKRPLQQLFTR